MPARKKDPSTRARRNKSPSRATLQRPKLASVEEYADLSMAQLRAAIDLLNEDRPADNQISKAGRKTELAERVAAASSPVPALPKHPPRRTEEGDEFPVEWDAQTVAWWNDVWTSPMAAEWDDSDIHNVMVVALLYDDIWAATSPKARKEALAEYRLQRADLGLSPYSRRRLEWTIETANEAKERGTRRRATAGEDRKPRSQRNPAGEAPADPRLTLVQ